MKFVTSIFLSLIFITAYLINGFFITEKLKPEDNLPFAENARIKKFPKENGPLTKGETFRGLDENSNFVREIKAKPSSRLFTEYGYVAPEKLKREGDLLGRAMVKRPDGKNVRALIVDYKGQLYDGEVGFPCFLSGDTLKALGIKISYF